MANDFCPTCPADCALSLPVVDCSTCITPLKGQVGKIFIGTVGNPLATEAALATRINNAEVATGTTIRVLCVLGQVDAPDVTTEELECNINIVTRRSYTLTVESNSLTDDNYAFSRTLQNCQGKMLLWYTMVDELHVYGGLTGIEVNINPVTQSTGNTRSDRLQTQYIISWEASCDPDRIANTAAGIEC